MKIAHNIKISVFAKEEEKAEVKKALLALLPDSVSQDILKKKFIIEEEVIKGDAEITILKATITKNRQINDFLKDLFQNLKEDSLENKVCKRIDERCRCYIRLDKQELLKGNYRLTYSGDCFHIKMTIASFPRKQKNAENIVCGFISKKTEK